MIYALEFVVIKHAVVTLEYEQTGADAILNSYGGLKSIVLENTALEYWHFGYFGH